MDLGALYGASHVSETTVSGSGVSYGDGDGQVGVGVGPGGSEDNLAAAIFISGGGQSDLSHENGPTLYIEPNRTSAIDDIRSVVIYIFIITILFSFFLILPGIRNEKFPTFLCITTSLVVTSIVMISLLGTTWHVAEAPISAAYKSFSQDRIQGDLEVRIGLQSVNVSLVARKYYFIHASEGPVIYDNSLFAQEETASPTTASTNNTNEDQNFKRKRRRSVMGSSSSSSKTSRALSQPGEEQDGQQVTSSKYVIKKYKVDINYNERFYWIEPNQMRQEYHLALQRGLPYPILTVVEYLSQDDAGFNWSRQYRTAGYYTTINLWLSICLCALMFGLHCAVPKYGIYAMQTLGCLLLFTSLTYAILVPRDERALVIPFEGQSLTFRFGRNFWLVLVGGCLSLLVGTVIVIIDNLFPSFIFTTVLDADFDAQQQCHYYTNKNKVLKRYPPNDSLRSPETGRLEKPPPFMRHHRSESGEVKLRERARVLAGEAAKLRTIDQARRRGASADKSRGARENSTPLDDIDSQR